MQCISHSSFTLDKPAVPGFILMPSCSLYHGKYPVDEKSIVLRMPVSHSLQPQAYTEWTTLSDRLFEIQKGVG